ncbi:hypothetical protein FNZ07_28530 [Paraburkholderia megapolitana]|nr:hypothetical protein FNZ07_28530 [Paraburkholderia megapolitana]
MVSGYPTEEELRKRISRQLSWHSPPDAVALIWRGYLAALLEWAIIENEVYERLEMLLPKVGVKEQVELFADELLSAERESEIDKSSRR